MFLANRACSLQACPQLPEEQRCPQSTKTISVALSKYIFHVPLHDVLQLQISIPITKFKSYVFRFPVLFLFASSSSRVLICPDAFCIHLSNVFIFEQSPIPVIRTKISKAVSLAISFCAQYQVVVRFTSFIVSKTNQARTM